MEIIAAGRTHRRRWMTGTKSQSGMTNRMRYKEEEEDEGTEMRTIDGPQRQRKNQ